MDIAKNNTEKAKHRLMIIDDSADELAIYAARLNNVFSITPVSSPDKAWELLNRQPLPDAIVLDIMLHNEDGLAFCSRIKENQYFKDIPIIFLSSIGDAEIKSQAFSIGAADFVVKPPIISELIARLSRHIFQYHKTKRLEALIYIDPLTHLPNASKLLEVLQQEWARCARYWHHLSLLLIRVENLHKIKEKFGNDEFYAVAASIADDLCSVGSRPGDLFASLTDDTFALLLSDCSNEGTQLKAKQIKQKFEHPHFMAKHEASAKGIYCTVACTVAAPAGGSTPQELMKKTEELLLNSSNIEHDGICINDVILGIDGISNSVN
jgi:diguanylate cyclase (GGDEF)-like protein